MSKRNVELVEEMTERFRAGDRNSWRERIADDVVWDTSGTELPNAGVYLGHEGIERFFIDWLGTWRDLRIDSVELIDAGDSVVSIFRWHGRGRTSGVETEVEMYGMYDLRDEKVIRYRQFDSRAEVIAAAGLANGD
ncbi:MAG: nuclear transport factor 2 family protein [Solirubrobacterales bacterium]